MTQHIPNALTLARIAAIPIIVALMFLNDPTAQLIAGIVFILAALTDFLDGYSARLLNVVSTFGKAFDPIADKMLVLSILMLLIYLNRAAIVPAIIILCREILITGMREYLSTTERGTIPVSWVAKYKTTFQLIALSCLLFFGQGQFLVWGNVILWIAAGLTVYSGYGYIRGALNRN